MGKILQLNADTRFAEHLIGTPDPVFAELFDDVFSLWLRWQDYAILYGQDESRKLLASVAHDFFAIHEHDAFNTIMLGIARLTDPPQQKGDNNLSIEQLPACLKDPARQQSMKKQIEDLCKSTEVKHIKEWRNKQGAHNDLFVCTGQTIKLRDQTTRDNVNSVLSSMLKILRASVTGPSVDVAIKPESSALKLLNDLKKLTSNVCGESAGQNGQ